MDESKKKLLIIAGGTVGALVLIIILLLVFNKLTNRNSFTKVESTVTQAAKNYYQEHEDQKPTEQSGSKTVTDSELSAAGYMKPLSELTQKLTQNSCNATVHASKSEVGYRYVTVLDCGEDYKTNTFIEYIKENEKVVTDGDGLYELNGELVYRGEDPNNYVLISDKSWRIVKFENNQAYLIFNHDIISEPWDNRYNSETEKNSGINDYSVSRVKAFLKEFIENERFMKRNDLELIARHKIYTGKRYITDDSTSGASEKANFLENQIIGLLPAYDYQNASLDKNCTSLTSSSCQNYNYLVADQNTWWTLTGDLDQSEKVYALSRGVIESYFAYLNIPVRPTIYLVEDALYESGSGTFEDPYILK